MYLKSLVLKGFKSFADRSVLTLAPGLTAIVGPNGSGKSNISDAVLWVLGERNAKHLRGQAMEDVIFAGSSARKAVGIAEVDLVLDNSDGTLPVEYDEVAITRRMYRSGESEYLINGTVVRRMDVLDILHDSGLGTDTHSIISQGSLDSILQSKPEDRRALIEEAAGVLKHKQRKEKSEHKLETMDVHLARVRDVTNEVKRQLAPLERKAKRARTYQGLAAELADLNLSLAVDDLRTLRRGWDEICQREQELEAEVEQRRKAVSEAEELSENLQEKIRQENLGAGELSRHTRRASAVVERFEGASMLMREKQRTLNEDEHELQTTLETNKEKRMQAELQQSCAVEQLEDIRSARSEADASVEQLQEQQDSNSQAFSKLEGEIEETEAKRHTLQSNQEQVRRSLSESRDTLTSGIAQLKLIEAHSDELKLDLDRARIQAEEQAEEAQQLEERLEAFVQTEANARLETDQAREQLEEARGTLDNARDELSLITSEIRGLEELERTAASVGPARAWLLERAEELGIRIEPLAQVLRASQTYETLVERLLGVDVATLLVDSQDAAYTAAASLERAGIAGEVVLAPSADANTGKSAWLDAVRAAASACGGCALIDELTYPASAAQAIETLLGDVVVCESLERAFAAHANSPQTVRYVTPQGWMVWPNGKVSSVSAAASDEEGVLARERQLDAARKRASAAQEVRTEAECTVATAEEELHKCEDASLHYTQQLAELRGQTEAARADARRAEEKLASVSREFEDVERRRVEAENTIAQARPASDELGTQLGELAEQLGQENARLNELQDAAAPLRNEADRIRDALAEAKLEAATLAERETYALRVSDACAQDLATLDESDTQTNEALVHKVQAQQRIVPLIAAFEALIKSAQKRLSTLEEASMSAQDSSLGLQNSANEARSAARAAHDVLDDATARLSETRVEKGRLDVQVDAAVNVIVHDCDVPLDQALEMPELENRGEAEEAAFKLRRRIANMGTINPDAAEEYEEMKQRYEYLAAQLDDLDSARRALEKVVRVIDARMKDDFIRTYEEVDRNFREIFAILFPGGTAELSLSDPDDLENTGVEVSAQPKGKHITKMMLLSGGEKSLTALALLFAVYRTRATPFYILDEVEAALDDSNLRRLLAYLDELRDTTQLIMITHQRRTMEAADVLFGVSMQADGVTKVVSQKLDRALQYAE